MPLALEVAAKTDVGCVRVSNEDCFGYDVEHGIFIVCDGMGGQAAGEIASKIAVDSLLAYFQKLPANKTHSSANHVSESISDRAMILAEAIQLANSAIREAASHNETQVGMGSTVVCVLMDQDFFSVGHVGDSRAYLIREGEIQQLTEDHSLVMRQVRLGLISADQAKKSTFQNVITQALGAENTVEPDLDDIMAIPGDILVLASDGLTRTLSDQDIIAGIRTAADLQQACDDLVQSAKHAGGEDNITCMLVRLAQPQWYDTYLRRFRIGRGR